MFHGFLFLLIAKGSNVLQRRVELEYEEFYFGSFSCSGGGLGLFSDIWQ